MPSIFSHAIVPIAARLGLGKQAVPRRLLLAGVVAAMLPDADVIGRFFGVTYGDALGHRGATHSITFALMLALLAAWQARHLRHSRIRCALFIGLSALSHPLLDMFTNGGRGVALWWPLSDVRIFAPWQPITVSPIGMRFFNAHGMEVITSECLWVWLPALGAGVLALIWRRYKPALRRDA